MRTGDKSRLLRLINSEQNLFTHSSFASVVVRISNFDFSSKGLQQVCEISYMVPIILLACIVCNKVFKKSTANGKVTLYLEKRNFADDQTDEAEPINGVVVVEPDYLKGKKIFGQLSSIYRYGREEDEIMGLKFSKEFILAQEQISPSSSTSSNLTAVQERLVQKFPENSFPFTFKFPAKAPNSVTLQPGQHATGKSLGISYSVKCFASDNDQDRGLKKSSASLIVKKLQYAPFQESTHLPTSAVTRYSSFGSGKLDLVVTMDKELYYHGEALCINVSVSNTCRRSVKDIKCYVLQHCELTMINARYSKFVASLETRDGCPIVPGSSFSKKFYMVPIASMNKNKFGIALDGYLKGEPVSLASSTVIEEGKKPEDCLGIVISYAVRVKLGCGSLGGDLMTDVPFRLMHPVPGSEEEDKVKKLIATQSVDRPYYESICYTNDEEGEETMPMKDFNRQKTIESEE